MNTKELKQILDKEIEFSRNSPLGKSLNPDFVDGFIKGLEQARYLIGASSFLDTLDTCLRSDRTRGLFITGKRSSGKTTKLIDAIRHIATNYSQYRAVIVAPTHEDVKSLAKELCKDSSFTYRVSDSLLMSVIYNNYSIGIYSGSVEDKYRFKGMQYDIVFIDDVEKVSTDTLEQLIICGLGSSYLDPAKLIVAGTELPTSPNLGVLTRYHL